MNKIIILMFTLLLALPGILATDEIGTKISVCDTGLGDMYGGSYDPNLNTIAIMDITDEHMYQFTPDCVEVDDTDTSGDTLIGGGTMNSTHYFVESFSTELNSYPFGGTTETTCTLPPGETRCRDLFFPTNGTTQELWCVGSDNDKLYQGFRTESSCYNWAGINISTPEIASDNRGGMVDTDDGKWWFVCGHNEDKIYRYDADGVTNWNMDFIDCQGVSFNVTSNGTIQTFITNSSGMLSIFSFLGVLIPPDIVPPTFSTTSINRTNSRTGDTIQIGNEVADGTNLSSVFFAWNDTGIWVNHSKAFVGMTTLTLNYTVNVTITAVASKVIGVQFFANDSSNNKGESAIRTFIVAGTTPPVLTLGVNNFFQSHNNSFLNLDVSKNVTLDLSFTDDISLFGFEVYILHSNGSIVFNLTNNSLSGIADSYFSYDNNISNYYTTSGTYTINVTVWDDHTEKRINNYDVDKGKNYLLFDNSIKISADKAVKSDTKKQDDRYTFEFEYPKSPPTKKVFYIESTGVLSYRRDSKYKAHFVDWESKKWIDFEGIEGEPIISKITDRKWRIEFDNADSKVILSSIGGLNSKTKQYKYYLVNPTISWFIPSETISRFTNESFSVSLNVTSKYKNFTSFRVFNSSQNLVQSMNVSGIGNETYFYNHTFSNLDDDTYYINATHFDQTGFSVNSTTIIISIATFNISIYDELTGNLLADRVSTIELSTGTFAQNYSTSDGGLSIPGLLSTEYLITYYADLYTKRDYFFTIDNISDFKVDLYLLSTTNGTEITFTVQDNSGNELSNALIHLKRYYISNNSYIIVSMSKTNVEGKTIIDVDFNDAYYQTLTTYGVFTVSTIGARMITTTFVITLNLIADPFETIDGVSDIVSAISFNNLTQTFSYTYNILSGATRTGTIEVYRVTPEEKDLKCSQSTSSSSATILCVVNTTATEGTYVAEGSMLVGTQNILLTTYEVATGIVKQARNIFGKQGLFLGIMLSGALAGLGAFVSPAVSIIMFLVGIFFSTYFGLVNWGVGGTILLISMIIIGGVIIYKVKS